MKEQLETEAGQSSRESARLLKVKGWSGGVMCKMVGSGIGHTTFDICPNDMPRH